MGRSTRGYRRRQRPAEPPFQAWGFTLFLIMALLVWLGAWERAALVGAFLAFYLLAVRLTPCRVETKQSTPCRWLVRGVIGTCQYHRGLKRGLPRLVPGGGWGAPPRFMWPRPDLPPAGAVDDPQPALRARRGEATDRDADRPAYDWIMMGLAAAGVLISLAGVIRDVTAG